MEGYFAFGSYVGNDDADGPFVYLGFKPATIILKNIDATQSWDIMNSAADPTNTATGKANLRPNTTAADDTNCDLDFLSNGFKVREDACNDMNGDGNTIIYCAWATNPFGGSGVAQARAR